MYPIPVKRTLNDYIPLDVGGVYNIGTIGSDMWVVITAIDENNLIYAQGIDNHIYDAVVPAWHFDDLVSEYYDVGLEIIAPNWEIGLVDENDVPITGG